MQHQHPKDPHLLTHDDQAIIALCSPRGSGAIALIRISGRNALDVADGIARCSSGKNLSEASSHTIHHGHVIDVRDGKVIDEVMFLVMRSPKTFTGQDTVEITCHNNQVIIDHIIDCAIVHGARQAQAGEFTRRAFLEGKIDLMQAEAVHDLISAQTELALRQSMATLKGSLSSCVNDIENQIIALLSYVEASFEFLDEEQRDFSFDQSIAERTTVILSSIKELRLQFAHQRLAKEGIRIAVIGLVNAGKSTLFNALIKRERAIVTEIEGTTRDSIEAGLCFNGNMWTLIDTAGLRQTDDVVEQIGIERSFSEAGQADIIVMVMDAQRTLTTDQLQQHKALIDLYGNKMIVVINKSDLISSLQEGITFDWLGGIDIIHVSAKHNHGIENLKKAIDAMIQRLFATLQSPFLLNQRQFTILVELEDRLQFIANSYYSGIHYELVAYKLKDLLEKISELTGKNVTEKVLDTVFGEFCIGK